MHWTAGATLVIRLESLVPSGHALVGPQKTIMVDARILKICLKVVFLGMVKIMHHDVMKDLRG